MSIFLVVIGTIQLIFTVVYVMLYFQKELEMFWMYLGLFGASAMLDTCLLVIKASVLKKRIHFRENTVNFK